jgi:glycine/D-amino acid oxidase-like deaminating enzyme
MGMTLPTQARVVIVGGGIAGCSTAYHLARLGITDVLLIEQGKLTCGTTWHAAGLVGQMRPNRNMTASSCTARSKPRLSWPPAGSSAAASTWRARPSAGRFSRSRLRWRAASASRCN